MVLDLSSIKSYSVICQIKLTCLTVKSNKLDLIGFHVSMDSKGNINPHLTADAEKLMCHKMPVVNSPKIQTK